jgi:type IV pilus assembly protein PilZ
MCAESDRPEGAEPQTAAKKSGKERRQAQRILINLEVDYHCEDTFLFAYITDLSTLGIFVRTNNPEPPGTHLNLSFTLPGEQRQLDVEGEVIWINPYRPGDLSNLNPGMGVRFLDLEQAQRRAIRRLIRTIAYLDGSAQNEEPEEEPVSAASDELQPDVPPAE